MIVMSYPLQNRINALPTPSYWDAIMERSVKEARLLPPMWRPRVLEAAERVFVFCGSSSPPFGIPSTLRVSATEGRAVKRPSRRTHRFLVESFGEANAGRGNVLATPFCEKENREELYQIRKHQNRASVHATGDRPTGGLGGLWKGAFPDDFDIEKALAELRQAQQQLDEEAAP